MSIYDQASIGTATNKIEFNTTTDVATFRILSRAPQRRNIRELDIPIVGESGISDFETLVGRYAYVLEGIIYPNGLSESEQAMARIRRLASLEISQDDPSSDGGYVPYSYQEVGSQKRIYVKVLYVDVQENTRKGLVQPFRLICKIKDPTIYGDALKLATTQTVDPTLSGGDAEFPVEFPVVFGASTFSATSVANNRGDLPSYPERITVYGPVSNPVITNETTGEFIQVNTNVASPTNVLQIRYNKDSVIVELDGNSVLGSTSGTYFKLQPGGNQITLSGASVGSGAYVEVAYRDSWPLS
jgi:hypothetical protein